jgi:hypothetical protein
MPPLSFSTMVKILNILFSFLTVALVAARLISLGDLDM